MGKWRSECQFMVGFSSVEQSSATCTLAAPESSSASCCRTLAKATKVAKHSDTGAEVIADRSLH